MLFRATDVGTPPAHPSIESSSVSKGFRQLTREDARIPPLPRIENPLLGKNRNSIESCMLADLVRSPKTPWISEIRQNYEKNKPTSGWAPKIRKTKKLREWPKSANFVLLGFFSYFRGPKIGVGDFLFRISGIQGLLGSVPGPQARKSSQSAGVGVQLRWQRHFRGQPWNDKTALVLLSYSFLREREKVDSSEKTSNNAWLVARKSYALIIWLCSSHVWPCAHSLSGLVHCIRLAAVSALCLSRVGRCTIVVASAKSGGTSVCSQTAGRPDS